MTEYPLTPAQQAIWFEDQVDPGVGNTGFFGVSLLGELREEHVAAACAAAVSRHSTMRTILRMHGEQPYLEVLPPATPLRYETIDVPCAPGEETATTRAWRDRYTRHRFDLATGPPVTFTLLRHGADRRSLLVVAHHLGYDGRSKFVFARAFCAALTDLRAGRMPQSAPLPWPRWPAATGEAITGASDYWKAAGIETYPPLRLPRRRRDGERTIGTTGEFFIDSGTRARLADLAEAHGVSLFAVMLAAVGITLYAYGNNRMVLCAPVDVTTAETRGLIGLGVNIVPFTLTVDDTDTVASVLAKAAAVRGHLKAYGAVPFQIVSAGKGWTAGSRALFSRLAVSYMRMATDVPQVPGLVTRWDFVAHNTARTFDLMIHMRDAYDRLVVRLDHAGADLDADAAAAIAEHLRGVLTGLPDRPATPLGTLALLPAESTAAAPVRVIDKGLPDLAALCAKWAAELGDQPAVVGPAGRLNYRDLALLCDRPQAAAVAQAIHALRVPTEPAPAAVPPPDARQAAALHWLVRHLGLATRETRVLQTSAPGSPDFWRECWLAWFGGGTLYLPGEALHKYAVNTVVAHHRELRDLAGLAPLRDVITPMAGLRPSAETVALARTGVRLHALYATAGVPVAVQTCTPDDLARGYTPVLRDLAPGIQLSIRGPHGHTVPHGVTGRLIIDAPFREDTGDLAEIDSTGSIRFHGAAALTVEWAGQRLEIPAIERYLMTHPDVDDAVVVCQEFRPVAYLVPRAGSDLDTRAARLHLRTRSVPGEPRLSQVHVIPELPRLPGGEVDRDALASIGSG